MTNPTKIELLQKKLKEVFQFEDQDLDFGIYRILNIKRKEILAFIDKELIDTIKEGIRTVEDNSSVKEELEKLRAEIEKSFGCNVEEAKKKYGETPKVKDYILKEADLKKSEKENDIEEEVYDDILDFFSRYYDRGDFISKRRYSKENKYAIPYNGEEVYLYWANNDQYYIKTAENFKNYSFKIEKLKVNFDVVTEEVEVEKGDIKGENKYFIFRDAEYDQKAKSLSVKFAYHPLSDEEKVKVKDLSKKERLGKDEVNALNLQEINQKIGIFGLSDLQKKHVRRDGEQSEKSELEWHLNKYTTKNTTDYFIHKDLKKFLDQELDFYIKNELLHVDDISEKAELEINLKRIRVFKEICRKIIDFLAQIEDFQKKLWEKKKFVVSTDYCITLDYIDEKYYPTILENKAQLEEWKKLFSLDVDEEAKKLKGTLHGHGKGDKKIEALKQNPTLVIDTKFFDAEFKYQLLSEIDGLDERTNGILINSENFQALNLLLNKFSGKIKSTYADPPYNTSASEILYKNNYKHSSWLSLIESRAYLAKLLLSEDGLSCYTIDDFEFEKYKMLLTSIYGGNNFLGVCCIRNNPAGRSTKKEISITHEYAMFFSSSEKSVLGRLKRTQKQIDRYDEKDSEGAFEWVNYRKPGSMREESPQMYYPLFISEREVRIPKMEWDTKLKEYKLLEQPKKNEKIIYPIDDEDMHRRWRWGIERLKKNLFEIKPQKKPSGELCVYCKGRMMNEGILPLTWWGNKEYSSTAYGTNLLKDIFGKLQAFSYPKSVFAVQDCLRVTNIKQSEIVLDFFAGSGTTGHAILKLNKEDEGNRRFILVEMGQYFDTVLKPRIEKVIFSDNWKEGKPLDNKGSKKQIIKYQSLEQYEDSLNNIDFKEPNKLVYDTSDYKLKYMLEFESQSNNVFLNLDKLDNPFDYKLKIEKNNETKEESIDLVETFNYIAGIDVKHIIRNDNGKTKYVFIIGKRQEKEVLVVWRNKDKNFDPVKEREFIKNEFKDSFDEIYTNGNSLIPNAKSVDEVFKANLFR